MNVNRKLRRLFHFLRINKIKQNERSNCITYLGHPVFEIEKSTWSCCCL